MKVLFVGSASMGPRFITGLLKKAGINCLGMYQGVESLLGDGQIDFFEKPISLEELKRIAPEIVAFSCTSSEFKVQLDMAQLVRDTLPEAIIIFGGVHPTIDPNSVIDHSVVDIICLGEGEYPMLELCQALESGKDIRQIKNLWVKDGDAVYKNELRPYVQNLDELPLDRDGIVYMGIYTGRGCKGNCFFCNTPSIKRQGATGRYFRKRSMENVLSEIEEIIQRYQESNLHQAINFGIPKKFANRVLSGKFRHWGVRAIEKAAIIIEKNKHLSSTLIPVLRHLNSNEIPPIRFKDDTFMLDKSWFIDFSRAFQERFPSVTYICQARANEIDEEVAEALAKSGCVKVSIGIECGNDEYRKKILKKGVSSQQIEKAVSLLKKNNIVVLGQWILGLPGETVEMALESMMLHRKLGDIPQVHIASPLPKTAMHDIAVEQGFIQPDYIPEEGLYGNFIFHPGVQGQFMQLVYNLFTVARLKVPLDMEELDFALRAGRQNFEKEITIGDMMAWGILNNQKPL